MSTDNFIALVILSAMGMFTVILGAGIDKISNKLDRLMDLIKNKESQ